MVHVCAFLKSCQHNVKEHFVHYSNCLLLEQHTLKLWQVVLQMDEHFCP